MLFQATNLKRDDPVRNLEIGVNREAVAKALSSWALETVEQKYGTGKGDGISPKKYHNRQHTEDVIENAVRIAQLALERKLITANDLPLITIAASFHDIEQNMGSGKNEEESARLATEQMQQAGIFSDEDTKKVREMIMATVVHFNENGLTQSATDSYLTKILADADLANLGSATGIYWSASLNLLHEITGKDSPEPSELEEFAQKQLRLLKHHSYYTEEASELFPEKTSNINFTKKFTTPQEKLN